MIVGKSLSDDDVLVASLQAAVPMWMLELGGRPEAELLGLARESADIVASKGDVILFRGGKRGETAAAFNALARGLAVMALVCPGGVTFAGQHWCADHAACERAADVA